ncbi:MAG: DUF559 domain-containing protein [Pirellulaceae bacterium]|nr:DUF559 domain-containing protein [Pirellulaceae bacterium]
MTRRKTRSKEATEFARSQRKGANEFAWTVWQWLRNRNCHGQKFRREVPVGPYTADFCCIELKLIIEIDGEPHLTDEGREHDRVRDETLRQHGYQVLHVLGYEVIREEGNAHERIWDFVRDAIELRDRNDG